MAIPELEKTPQGFEQQFGTNFLGHFALTYWLRKPLAAANGARVVSLSSSGHFYSPVNFDDLNFDFIPYTPFGAYGQSKTADALLAVAITRHWASDGIFSNAVNPGAIATGLQRYTGGLKTPVERRKTPEQGAATSFCLRLPRLLGGSEAFISRTATNPIVSRSVRQTSAAVSPPTPLMQEMRSAFGRWLLNCFREHALCCCKGPTIHSSRCRSAARL
jgi:NAD(P)-dependent dehydrogenase (short-subunit alcohol dehydrogenase family)